MLGCISVADACYFTNKEMEVCVDSVQSAKNAESGGARRVELCASLIEGGTTPSIGMLKMVKRHVTIPVFVMIRPRGGDFCYSTSELEVMKEDIIHLKNAGADGFVFGILTKDGEVNVVNCKELFEILNPLPATFHRAIDMSRDVLQSLAVIKSLGFQRVLSSGGQASALDGVSTLEKMVKEADESIIVMPGGGIRADNIEKILIKSGAKEFHGSARETVDSFMVFRKPSISMGILPDSEYISKVTSVTAVKMLVSLSNSVWDR